MRERAIKRKRDECDRGREKVREIERDMGERERRIEGERERESAVVQ